MQAGGVAGSGAKHVETGRHKPKTVAQEQPLSGRIESRGPGKNVLVRKQSDREDAGPPESPGILSHSAPDGGDDEGVDPYNSGMFDKSRNWEKTRK